MEEYTYHKVRLSPGFAFPVTKTQLEPLFATLPVRLRSINLMTGGSDCIASADFSYQPRSPQDHGLSVFIYSVLAPLRLPVRGILLETVVPDIVRWVTLGTSSGNGWSIMRPGAQYFWREDSVSCIETQGRGSPVDPKAMISKRMLQAVANPNTGDNT